MRAHPNMSHVHLDWNELSKVVKLDIDQNKARLIGVTSQGLSNVLNSILIGLLHHPVSRARQADRRCWRAPSRTERLSLDDIRDINVPTQSGKWVPLSQVATISYAFEEGVIWRRNRVPTITVQGDIVGNVQAPVVTKQLDPKLEPIRAQLPPGYRIEVGGATSRKVRAGRSR